MTNIEADEDFRTPGQLIQFLLEERGWTQRVLAIVLKMDETGLNKVILGKRLVDAQLAIALGEVFKMEAERFLDIQKCYDLAQARLVTRPDPSRATRATLFGDLPIAEMIKRGWIDADDVRDLPKIEVELKRFFGAKSLDEIELLPHAAKKTDINAEVTPAQLAWIYRVKTIAKEILVPPFAASDLRETLPKLRTLMTAPEEARKVPRLLADCGIRFILAEGLSAAKIDGVCFWLKNSPVIALALRYDRIDNFWFVLRHELEHVLQEHGKERVAFDAELEGDRAGNGPAIPHEERIANEAAGNFCVPTTQMDAFLARKAPLVSERDLIGFARILGVHPGIVAGQLANRTKRYDRFRQHLAKIRSSVMSSAFTDGWGNVYPAELGA